MSFCNALLSAYHLLPDHRIFFPEIIQALRMEASHNMYPFCYLHNERKKNAEKDIININITAKGKKVGGNPYKNIRSFFFALQKLILQRPKVT